MKWPGKLLSSKAGGKISGVMSGSVTSGLRMNFKGSVLNLLLVVLGSMGLNACGVKGDPLPPERPAHLGRGRPTYKGATEEIKIEKGGKRNVVSPDTDAEEKDEREEH